MTRDDILRMAIKCQLVTMGNRDGIYMEALEHFAGLVAAAEREACALLCDNLRDGWGWDNDGEIAARDCANAIRERGKNEPPTAD